MSFRAKVISLSVVGAVLLGLFILGSALSPTGSAQRAQAALLFPGLRASDVQRIELQGQSTVSLARAGTAWTMESSGQKLPASRTRADELVREVASLARGTLVSRSPSAAADLGIGGQSSVLLVLRDASDRVLAQLESGNRGPAGQGVYIRATGSPDVWLTGETLSSYLKTDRRFWADLRVLPPDVRDDLVMRLTVESSMARPFSWTVTREKDPRYGGQWSAAEGIPGALSQEKVNALVGSLAGLVGTDFALPGERDKVIAHPRARITVSLVDNRTFVLLFGGPGSAGDYPCVLETGDLCWLVPAWRERELLVPPAGLLSAQR